ncbi:DUF58 domain-containing protein [Paenibacillus piri]|uniref:DUF58 domain-containing protein n=1 Tax=Paenibacillus piri TaxID=2547395 RepID=A0A4R5KGF9_9BACL|nr:DUF58 domain-containing protein [Paenibacillus piri]TDF93785.1 DUF58 domain-containing protein [Paenibacillus piri]
MSGSGLLLDSDLMLRLDALQLAAKNRVRGTMQGKRRSRQLGSSLEFADYRLYTPGDDTRQFDWNVFGRTGKPFIKQFMDEQELQVNLYIDCSQSMDFGAGSANKFLYARQLAASIGYIALAGYDRVSARLFSDRIGRQLPMLRGKGSMHRLMQFLEQAAVEPSGDMAAAMMQPSQLPRQPGVTWLFSDFLYESGIEESLSYLLAARQELVVVQVLSPQEMNPELTGDLRLIDSESLSGKEVAVTGRVIKAYREAVGQYTRGLQRFCHERGMGYVLTVTDTPLLDTVQRAFRQGGLLL